MDLGRLKEINPWCYALTLLPGEAARAGAPVRRRGTAARHGRQGAGADRQRGAPARPGRRRHDHARCALGLRLSDRRRGRVRCRAGRHHFGGRRRLRHFLRHPLPAQQPRPGCARAAPGTARRRAVSRHSRRRRRGGENQALPGRTRRGDARRRATGRSTTATAWRRTWNTSKSTAASPAPCRPRCPIWPKSASAARWARWARGNHYLEVQVVERIYDAAGRRRPTASPRARCWCPSTAARAASATRSAPTICVTLAKAAGRLGIRLPDRELACAPIKSPEGQQYLGAMNAAINLRARQSPDPDAPRARSVCRSAARGRAGDAVRRLAQHLQGWKPTWWTGKPRLLYVHRKGATRAFGPGHPALPRALSRSGAAGDHRRQHGHRFLDPRRQSGERRTAPSPRPATAPGAR